MIQPMVNLHILIPCAGSGSRFGSNVPKQYHVLAGKTVLDWTLNAFIDVVNLQSINVIYAPQDPYIMDYVDKFPQVNFMPVGGNSRAESVLNGLHELQMLHAANDWVLVHDAARCCLDFTDLTNLIEQITTRDNIAGGILATVATDTIKLSSTVGQNVINKTLDRRQIYLAQTPQMFRLAELIEALTTADLSLVTDEASAIELLGKNVYLIEAQQPNFKITYPHELKLAEFLLNNRLGEID